MSDAVVLGSPYYSALDLEKSSSLKNGPHDHVSDFTDSLDKRYLEYYRRQLEEESIGREFWGVIEKLPDSNYKLLKSIPIRLKCVGSNDWIACFDEANIAMSGNDRQEAQESLAHDIIYTMEDFCAEEDVLIPDLKESLRVLREYVKVSE